MSKKIDTTLSTTYVLCSDWEVGELKRYHAPAPGRPITFVCLCLPLFAFVCIPSLLFHSKSRSTVSLLTLFLLNKQCLTFCSFFSFWKKKDAFSLLTTFPSLIFLVHPHPCFLFFFFKLGVMTHLYKWSCLCVHQSICPSARPSIRPFGHWSVCLGTMKIVVLDIGMSWTIYDEALSWSRIRCTPWPGVPCGTCWIPLYFPGASVPACVLKGTTKEKNDKEVK